MIKLGDTNPVQHLSIQWLDLNKVPDSTKSLSKIIDEIIKTHNQKRIKNHEEGYELDVEDVLNNYSVKAYDCGTKTLSRMAQQIQPDPKETNTFHFILFFYQERPRRCIIALTSSNAWLVVRPYMDYSFSMKVAEKVANPKKIIELVRRCLFGRNIKEDLVNPGTYELYKTSNLYYLIENFKCDLKDDSSLFSLINSIKKTNRCWIKVTAGGILRIGKRFAFKNYPDIFNLLAKYVEGEPTHVKGNPANAVEKSDPLFNFLHFLQPAYLPKQQLDELLIKQIVGKWKNDKKELFVDVRHKYLEDFLFSNSFEIEINNSNEKIGSKPPDINDIIEKIGAGNNEAAFKRGLREGKLIFKSPNSKEKHTERIIDCIEGEIKVPKVPVESHFKIKKMWYILEADYLALLCEDFKEMIKTHLIRQNTHEHLYKSWKGNAGGEKEEDYHRSYLNTVNENYLVFDQICPDNIEPCDILKYSETEDIVYLYHVKEKFGQHTRDACSQILNAATMIRSALAGCQSPNYLEKLWKEGTKDSQLNWRKKLKSQLDSVGEDFFMNIFRTRKVVFVYAYLPNPDKSFSRSLTEIEKPIEASIVTKLMHSKYFDSNQRLTGKFVSTTKKNFLIDLKGTRKAKKIFNQLNAGRFFSRSTLGKIELVQLAQNLRELNFGVKIFEIDKR